MNMMTIRKRNNKPSGEDSRIRNDSELAVTTTDFLSTDAISTSLSRGIVRNTRLPAIKARPECNMAKLPTLHSVLFTMDLVNQTQT